MRRALTLTLSRRERGPVFLPLPPGEGRDEGELCEVLQSPRRNNMFDSLSGRQRRGRDGFLRLIGRRSGAFDARQRPPFQADLRPLDGDEGTGGMLDPGAAVEVADALDLGDE